MFQTTKQWSVFGLGRQPLHLLWIHFFASSSSPASGQDLFKAVKSGSTAGLPHVTPTSQNSILQASYFAVHVIFQKFHIPQVYLAWNTQAVPWRTMEHAGPKEINRLRRAAPWHMPPPSCWSALGHGFLPPVMDLTLQEIQTRSYEFLRGFVAGHDLDMVDFPTSSPISILALLAH